MWRDEAHGRPRRDDDDSADDDESPQRQADNAEVNTPSSPAPRSSPSRSSLRGSSPTSGTSHVPMPSQREQRPASDPEEDEQEAFWKSLDEFTGDSSDAPQAPTTAANSSVDGDDYMWDILDDIETPSTTLKPASVPPQSTSAVEVTTTANPSTDIADDWDDMYL